MAKTKLNNLIKQLIVPCTDAKHADQLYQLIVDMEYMDGFRCGWKEDSVNVEGIATVFWYQNPIVAVHYIHGNQLIKEHFSCAPVKQIDASGACIYAEI